MSLWNMEKIPGKYSLGYLLAGEKLFGKLNLKFQTFDPRLALCSKMNVETETVGWRRALTFHMLQAREKGALVMWDKTLSGAQISPKA